MLATSSMSAARPASIFANGRGVSLLSAVWGKRTGGPDSPAIYQLQPERWSPALLKRVKDHGFGFIRLVTTPVPLMTDDPAALDRSLTWVSSLVDQANDAGLAVVVDLHFWPTDAPLTQDTMTLDPVARAALVRAEVALAQQLAKHGGNRVALELLNEPFCNEGAGPSVWVMLQRAIVARVRTVAPNLPLVLTACRSRYDRLRVFDASPYRTDRNVYWTFHYYEPGVFTDQDGHQLRSVPFPPKPALAGSAAAMEAMLPGPTVPSRRHTAAELHNYLLTNRGRATIAAHMAEVAAWARRSGIAPNRIYLGEFAPLLSASPSNERIRADQLRWIEAVRKEAERRGFSWAYWGVPGPGSLNHDSGTHFFRADALRALGLAEADQASAPKGCRMAATKMRGIRRPPSPRRVPKPSASRVARESDRWHRA